MTDRGPFHRLVELIRRQRAPCDGCEHQRLCAAERLACEAFSRWVYRGQLHEDWPRVPLPEIYARVFSSHDGGEG